MYLPASGIGPGASLGQQDAYLLAQRVVAELPKEDRERVYLLPPGVLPIGRAPCWMLSLKWGSYYCAITGDAVIGPGSANKVRLAGGEAGIWFLIGHELGHGKQPLSSLFTTESYPRENNADCLAGAYVAEHLGRGVRRNVMTAAHVLGGNNPSDWDFHGTPRQRMEAARLGFDAGAEACWAHSLL